MSSCFSGGGRTYAFELDIVKSPSTSTRTSQISSPSSTLSESSNSALAISTRKPRTPRKRPNQTYNEAAALLSTAYPNIFSTKTLTNPRKSTKPHDSFLDPSSSELLLPLRLIDNPATFLLHNPILEKPNSRFEPKSINSFEKSCNSPGEFNSPVNFDSNPNSSMEICDDFDAESMLDEEIEEGIDSIMGSSTTSMNIDSVDESSTTTSSDQMMMGSCYGYPMGLGFGGNLEFGFGFRRGGVRPLRQVDDGVNWWSFPTVDVLEISPRFNKSRPSAAPPSAGKKKKKKMEKLAVVESKLAEKSGSPKTSQSTKEEEEEPEAETRQLMLKLDYDDVLNAWSDKASPFPEELQGGADGNDVSARLAQIDLFTDAGGLREASVLRYKEKRRTRLFSKKIRYQVRKVNADRRPRMKGRFVRRPNSSTNSQRQKEI
ncbi:PREDICTED: protein CHLOROPLAST IMPORT APPARATUS 2-like isoform X1 [Fragaria vesca subsp. vesca]|uniref:protein CHLOROPLAST IMPORT APPARATUS 2-like isoform X1 n=1 Tax=Fragaria vesca subsp. vesca TaxID=101020 RepID=UPI0002C3222E|nr:PREDICTED: protein CHLOROPLAST IMPORT APPARATUS 2-like isoform X1 [Fragaria vesca subsp. vesca]